MIPKVSLSLCQMLLVPQREEAGAGKELGMGSLCDPQGDRDQLSKGQARGLHWVKAQLLLRKRTLKGPKKDLHP